jgi:hypothetical protein
LRALGRITVNHTGATAALVVNHLCLFTATGIADGSRSVRFRGAPFPRCPQRHGAGGQLEDAANNMPSLTSAAMRTLRDDLMQAGSSARRRLAR